MIFSASWWFILNNYAKILRSYLRRHCKLPHDPGIIRSIRNNDARTSLRAKRSNPGKVLLKAKNPGWPRKQKTLPRHDDTVLVIRRGVAARGLRLTNWVSSYNFAL